MLRTQALVGPCYRMVRPIVRTTSTANLKDHTSPGCFRPLIQHFRTRWPDPAPETAEAADAIEAIKLPERTVPDEHLFFALKFSNQPGTTIFFPHLKTNPKDRKVVLTVSTFLPSTVPSLHCLSP